MQDTVNKMVIRQHDEDGDIMAVRSHEDCRRLLQSFVDESAFPATVEWAQRMLNGECDYFTLADGDFLMWVDADTVKASNQLTVGQWLKASRSDTPSPISQALVDGDMYWTPISAWVSAPWFRLIERRTMNVLGHVSYSWSTEKYNAVWRKTDEDQPRHVAASLPEARRWIESRVAGRK